MKPVLSIYIFKFVLQDEDLQEIKDLAPKVDTQFGQFSDGVIVNDNLQAACAQVSAAQKAQKEPLWGQETWIFSAAVLMRPPASGQSLNNVPHYRELQYQTHCNVCNFKGLQFIT